MIIKKLKNFVGFSIIFSTQLFLSNFIYSKEGILLINKNLLSSKAYIRYSLYDMAGMHIGYQHYVWIKEETDNKCYLRIYGRSFYYTSYAKDIKSQAFLPESLDKFDSVELIDLEKLQVIKYDAVFSNRRAKNSAGQWMYHHEFFDESSGIYESEWGIWNGYETKIQKGRTKVDKNLPFFNYVAATMSFPIGFLDIQKGGMAQFVSPNVLRTPVIGRLKIEKEEKIETTYKTYDTIKVVMDTEDFLLRLLMGRTLSKFCIYWIDKESRLVVRRSRESAEVSVLDTYEEFTNWSDVTRRLNKEWVEQVCFKRLGIE
ncbi:MAG: hypothetical protein WHS77_01440 [Brevinematales bacterium]